jgi:alanine dehydrogenase
MLIDVPKEVKTHEFRVGLTATSVEELVRSGHRVLVQAGAGNGIGQDDTIYRRAGATVVDGAGRRWLHNASGRGRGLSMPYVPTERALGKVTGRGQA